MSFSDSKLACNFRFFYRLSKLGFGFLSPHATTCYHILQECYHHHQKHFHMIESFIFMPKHASKYSCILDFLKRNKDHGIFNPKGKTSMHSSDIVLNILNGPYIHKPFQNRLITSQIVVLLALQIFPHDLYSFWITFLSLERLPKSLSSLF